MGKRHFSAPSPALARKIAEQQQQEDNDIFHTDSHRLYLDTHHGRKTKASRAAAAPAETQNDGSLTQTGVTEQHVDNKKGEGKDEDMVVAPVGNSEEIERDGSEEEEDDEKEAAQRREEDDFGDVMLEEGFYEVEAIRKKRVRKGKTEFLIKWGGWPESANTWEPYDNVQGCEEIIKEFEKSHVVKEGKRGRAKRKIRSHLSPKKKKYLSDYSFESHGAEESEQEISTAPGLKSVVVINSEGTMPVVTPSESGNTSPKEMKMNKITAASDVSQPAVIVGPRREKVTAEHRINNGDDFERSEDKLVSDGEPLVKDVMIDTTTVHMPVIGTSPEIPHEENKTISRLTAIGISRACREIFGNPSTVNRLSHLKEETLFPDTAEGLKMNVVDEVPCRLSSLDKCKGAKKRKQGFVRRVSQGLDSLEHDKKQMRDTGKVLDTDHFPGDSNVPNQGDSFTHADKVLPNTTEEQNQQDTLLQSCDAALSIREIIKAVTYSSSMTNGKQDVTVLFKALRSDGQEVMVDNKFLRANYPMLLLDFYEQHLRYSTAH